MEFDNLQELIDRRDVVQLQALLADSEDWPETPIAIFMKGRAFETCGQTAAAQDAFQHCIAIKPDHAPARMSLVKLLDGIGNRSAATELLDESLKVLPKHQGLRLLTYRRALDSGHPEDVAEQAEAFAAEAPDFLHAQILNVDVMRALGRRNEARAAAKIILQKSPRASIAALKAAQIELEDGQPGQARRLLAERTEDLAQQPQMLQLYLTAALQEASAEGLAEAEQLLDVEDPTPTLLFQRGRIHRARHDDAAAEQAFREALSADPGLLEARAALARLLRGLGRLSEAADVLNDGLKTAPTQYPLLLEDILVRTERLPEGLSDADFQRLIQNKPAQPAGHERLVDWLIDSARFLDADRAIDAYFASCPGSVSPVILRSRARLSEDRAAEAIDVIGEIDETTHVGLLEAYARASRAAGRSDQAERALRLAMEKGDDLPSILAAARIAILVGAPRDAVTHLRPALATYPASIEARALLARAELKTGDSVSALATVDGAQVPVECLPSLALTRADAEIAMGDADAAMAGLDLASEHIFDAVQPARAILHARMGAPEKAIETLTAWQPEPVRTRAQRELAFVSVRATEFDTEAMIRHAKAALALHPWLPDAHGRIAQARLWQMDGAGTVESLDAANRIARRFGFPPRRRRDGLDGQLANELLIERDLARDLAEAVAGDDPVRDLSALMEKASHVTMAAIGLLIALRRAGRLAVVDRAQDGGVPPVLYSYTDKAETRPDFAGAVAALAEANPWADLRAFDTMGAAAYLLEYCGHDVHRAFHLARSPAGRSDIFRLAVLAQSGGIVLDPMRPVRHDLRALLPSSAQLTLVQDATGAVGPGPIAATPRHPVIEEALDDAVRSTLDGAKENTELVSGSGVISRVVARWVTSVGAEAFGAGEVAILSSAELLTGRRFPGQ